MPFVTFTVRRGLIAADKSRLSAALLETQASTGYHRADRFSRFLEVDRNDLMVDSRFPGYTTDRTDRFVVIEVIISSGRPTGTARHHCGRSGRTIPASAYPLITCHSTSLRSNRITRAFQLSRSGKIRARMLSRDIGNLRMAASRQDPSFAKRTFNRKTQRQWRRLRARPSDQSHWSEVDRDAAAYARGA